MVKSLKIKKNSGMTYIELIVVMSIFASISSVVFFNYGGFQSKIDTKNLASDIALKIVQAQKTSLSGYLPPPAQQAQITSTWKPSYGFYVDRVTDDKSFIYFTDLDQNGDFTDVDCLGNWECLEKITITKGNSISSLDVVYQGGGTFPLNQLTVTFSRPSSGAMIKSNISFSSVVSYVQITVLSPKGNTALIKIYPSGRIQIN